MIKFQQRVNTLSHQETQPTILRVACESDDDATVTLLLEKGADLHKTSLFNRYYDGAYNCDVPPIEAACKCNRPNTVLVLLKRYISTGANEQLVRYSIEFICLTEGIYF
jgi:ankyrin repeat protein